MKKGLLFFVFVSTVLFSQHVNAQCSESLKKAQSSFDQGHLYGIPALLEKCLEKGFSDQDKLDAYQLLTLTYLYIDDPISAERSFLDLLALDPEYRVDSTGYIELLHLSKEYITTPIVSFRARFGVNMSTVTVTKVNGPYNLNDNNEKYKVGFGYSAIGSMDIHFSKNISASIEGDFSYRTFKYQNTVYNVDGNSNAKDLINLNEKSYNIGLPISISYTKYGETYYPYIYAGYSPEYNIITNTDAVYTKRDNDLFLTTEDKNLNLTSIRNRFVHSGIIGIGLKRRINYNYVFVDLRYKFGFTNRLNGDTQNNFEVNENINRYTLLYQQQDNDFRQNEFTFTIGYMWPKYEPRKRKSVTAKSFISSVFKKKKDE